MGALDMQVKEMKSMGDAIHKLESRRENSFSQEKLLEEPSDSGESVPINVLEP